MSDQFCTLKNNTYYYIHIQTYIKTKARKKKCKKNVNEINGKKININNKNNNDDNKKETQCLQLQLQTEKTLSPKLNLFKIIVNLFVCTHSVTIRTHTENIIHS